MDSIAILCGHAPQAHRCSEAFVAEHSIQTAFVSYMGDPSESLGGRNSLNTTCRNRNVPLKPYVNEKELLKEALRMGVDTIICLWWPHILKKLHHSIRNVINTHPSLLPYNRGKYPYYWSIMDGTPFGVTIHRINDGVDTGDILWQHEIKVRPTDTGETLYQQADSEMAGLFIQKMSDIAKGLYPDPTEQDDDIATGHRMDDLDVNSVMDLDDYEHVGHLIDDLRARTFNNKHSGRVVIMDGRKYRIHLKLVEDADETV